VRRVRTETEAKREARIREERRRAESAAAALPVEDLTLQVNAAVSFSLKERVAVYGMTGTGKTTWVRQLLPRLWLVFRRVGTNIIDSKGYHEYDDLSTRLWVGPTAPPPAKPGEVLVWVIPGAVDKDQLDVFLKQVQATGAPGITVIDEIANFGHAGVFVEGLDLLLKQGRFVGQMVIAMGQEYAGNSRNLFGQTSHVLRFHLLNPYDGRELNKMLGLPVQPGKPALEPPAPYGFFYRRIDRPSPVLAYSGWQEFFRF
jgi:Cdc6-like AAA superfamily ATPase